MSDSTPPKKDPQKEEAYREYQVNLEMWRHYDNLRQDKSKTFLTAQTILIGVSGIVIRSQGLDSPLLLLGFILAVSFVGFGSSMLWFLLLYRNAGYIQFHRMRVKELEAGRLKELEPGTEIHFTTFTTKWSEFDKQLWPRRPLQLWRREGRTMVKLFGSSNMIDRLLALLFTFFWLVLLVVGPVLYVVWVFPF
jgi:hypothetical protein